MPDPSIVIDVEMLKALRVKAAFRRLLNTEDGKTVMSELSRLYDKQPCFAKSTIIREGAGGRHYISEVKYDPYYAAIRDGQRQVFLFLEQQADNGPEFEDEPKKPETTQVKSTPRPRKKK